MQSEIPKSSELDETNCNILDLRVGEEEFDRTYDFIQQKQLTPFFQSMQQINAAADAFTGHLKPMLDKLYKILEENQQMIDNARMRLLLIERKSILTTAQADIQKLVNDYKVTKEEISKCADLTDHTMKKVFDCLSLLLENAVLDWKTIKEKMFCITGKKEFENVEFLAKLVQFKFDNLPENKFEALRGLVNDQFIGQSQAFRDNQFQVTLLFSWCKTVLETAVELKKWDEYKNAKESLAKLEFLQNDNSTKEYWEFQEGELISLRGAVSRTVEIIQNNIGRNDEVSSKCWNDVSVLANDLQQNEEWLGDQNIQIQKDQQF